MVPPWVGQCKRSALNISNSEGRGVGQDQVGHGIISSPLYHTEVLCVMIHSESSNSPSGEVCWRSITLFTARC